MCKVATVRHLPENNEISWRRPERKRKTLGEATGEQQLLLN
jgi:hypothetical protein